jgi:Ceramidase
MFGASAMAGISVRQIATAAALTLLSMLAIQLLLAALGPNWTDYAPATCLTTHCFCEAPRTGHLVLQPANSWSSYSYAFGGFLMIALARSREWRSGFVPLAATVFGITAIFVGLGSVLLHATLTLWGQFFDVMGMYLVSGFMLVSAVARWQRYSDKRAAILYLVVVCALIAVLAAMPEVRRWLFAVVLLSAIILELGFAKARRPTVALSYFMLGMAVQAIAFTIWNLDQSGWFCSPQSLIQGHAVWHLLGATALWCNFLYYRSETRLPAPNI